jgi:hypothetical protein
MIKPTASFLNLISLVLLIGGRQSENNWIEVLGSCFNLTNKILIFCKI